MRSAPPCLRSPRCRCAASRGPLSLERLPSSVDPSTITLGDPGIFAADLLEVQPPKRWAIGFLPHLCDRKDPRVSAAAETIPHSRIINVMAHPLRVIGEIAACDFVFSSSLHGLIVADSLNVPNHWMKLSDNIIGHEFKFRDYCAALGKALPRPFGLDSGVDLHDTVKSFTAAYVPGRVAEMSEGLRRSAPF